MMSVFVARQPIFDRNMNVYGYELQYRYNKVMDFHVSDNFQDVTRLTNAYFLNQYFEQLTNSTKAFINFQPKMIIEGVPTHLSKQTMVVQVLETKEIDHQYILSLQKLRAKGYTITLDVSYFNQSFLPLLEVVDFIKLDFTKANMVLQKMLLKRYHNKIKFIAKKIETKEEYEEALRLGYNYFQGYFFKTPEFLKSDKDLNNINPIYIKILSELDNVEIDFDKLGRIVKRDHSLYKRVLMIANSAQFGTSQRVLSIKQAIIRIGTKELRKWIYLIMFRDLETNENKELLRTFLIRGRLMEQLAIVVGESEKMSSYFITGLFSEIDQILGIDMAIIVEELALSADVKAALLGGDTCIKDMLDKVIGFENHTMWPFSKCDIGKLSAELVMKNYIEALSWEIETL